MTNNVITVIDVGSTKVCCCIANVFSNGRFEIIGVGYCACLGIKAGVIVDLKSVEKSIAKAVENAEQMVNFRIKSVYVSISGKEVKSNIVNISLDIGGRIITNEDVMNLFDYCNTENEETAIIHSIPVFYSVDSLSGISNPVGMIANNLSVSMNLVSVPQAQLNNLLMCLLQCHLEPVGIVASIYASGLSVMDDDDDTLSNQIIIDLGGGTTSIGFFYKGVFSGMEVIPLGGKNITSDVAYGLNISFANAERLKTLHGSAFTSIYDESYVIFAPTMEDDNVINLQKISKSSINQIIQPRVEEILNIAKKRIAELSGSNNFSGNIILTGGGSMLTGIRDFACGLMNRKVKIKKIENSVNKTEIQMSNDFSVAIGMIKFAQMNDERLIKLTNLTNKKKNQGFFQKTLAWINGHKFFL